VTLSGPVGASLRRFPWTVMQHWPIRFNPSQPIHFIVTVNGQSDPKVTGRWVLYQPA